MIMDVMHYPPTTNATVLPFDHAALHQMCHIHCDAAGAAYMALQYGNECWCSLYGDLDYGRHGVGTCDMPCGGDGAVTCGGYIAVNKSRVCRVPCM